MAEPNPQSSGDSEKPKDRRAEVKRDIARRLRPICPQFSDAEFEILLEKMTESQISHEKRSIEWGRAVPTRPTGPQSPLA